MKKITPKIYLLLFLSFFLFSLFSVETSFAQNCSDYRACTEDKNCPSDEFCNKIDICSDNSCPGLPMPGNGCSKMISNWNCLQSEFLCAKKNTLMCENGFYKMKNDCGWWSYSFGNLSCSSTNCTKGETLCVNGHFQSCVDGELGNILVDLGPNSCVSTNCNASKYFCDSSVYKYCYIDSRNGSTFAVITSNSCEGDPCADNYLQKCDSYGNLYHCVNNKWHKSPFYKCQSSEPFASSSSSSSQASLPQDSVPPNPASNVKAEYYNGDGATTNDRIKFSWAWAGDNTCSSCEPAVGYCAQTTPNPGVTGYPIGNSTGPTPFTCNPDEVGPFWWQIINETTGQPYKQFYSGAQNIANTSTTKALDGQGKLYPPGGTIFNATCNDTNRHNVFRIDVDTRDARGKITGQQGSVWPNVRSAKTSCCFGQAIGNADCSKTNTEAVINETDYNIWKGEYLNGGITNNPAGTGKTSKWSDFDFNTAVTLKDFEIWRANQSRNPTPTPTPIP